MFNRLTINNVSFFISLLILGVTSLFYWACSSISFETINWFLKAAVALLFVLCVFLVVKAFLSNLVFSRLKLIYKIINDPSSKKMERVGPEIDANTNLNIVNKEVLEWAAKRKNEIEDLKKLEKYRKNFLGNISHELKTPLFSIQGYLHTLFDGGLEDESINRRYIEKAVSNAERLQFIIDDLEIINKLEEDSKLDKTEFNLKRLIEEVIGDLEIVSKEKSIKLVLQKTREQGLWVEADRPKIRQVIENLLTNSIKYGVENGKTKISLSDLGNVLKIEISDNGIGVEEKHIKHLFDRFYRVDKSRARKSGGSGLGLAIVKHILEAHEVKIEVRSEENKGTVFSFSLPKMKYSIEIDS